MDKVVKCFPESEATVHGFSMKSCSDELDTIYRKTPIRGVSFLIKFYGYSLKKKSYTGDFL